MTNKQWREKLIRENDNTKLIFGTDTGLIAIIPKATLKKWECEIDGELACNYIFNGTYDISIISPWDNEHHVRLKLRGEYYFGDPCQAVPHEKWGKFCDTFFDKIDDFFKSREMIFFPTSGDGTITGHCKKVD